MNDSLIIVGSVILTWAALFPVRAGLRRAGVVDRPNARSSHEVPTVRGAGTGIVMVLAAAMAWLSVAQPNLRLALLLVAFAALGIVSFVDDVRSVSPAARFATQAAAAAVGVYVVAGGISGVTLVLSGIAWLWIAGYTNAFNFMDGINGIAGVQAIVTGIGTALIAVALGVPGSHPVVLLSCVTAGTTAGFLPHNFPRARVFMGDVGSAPLGFLLATLAFWAAQQTSWWVLFWIGLLHANFVLDTAITLVRRALRHERLHESHREHFYQRLVRVGYSHTQVTLTEAGLQVLVAVALWWATPAGWRVKAIVAVAIIALWLGYFAFAEREFRRATRRNFEMLKS